jgi:hypothetical protein
LKDNKKAEFGIVADPDDFYPDPASKATLQTQSSKYD